MTVTFRARSLQGTTARLPPWQPGGCWRPWRRGPPAQVKRSEFCWPARSRRCFSTRAALALPSPERRLHPEPSSRAGRWPRPECLPCGQHGALRSGLCSGEVSGAPRLGDQRGFSKCASRWRGGSPRAGSGTLPANMRTAHGECVRVCTSARACACGSLS